MKRVFDEETATAQPSQPNKQKDLSLPVSSWYLPLWPQVGIIIRWSSLLTAFRPQTALLQKSPALVRWILKIRGTPTDGARLKM